MSRLIIKNLPKKITEEKIRQVFSQKGEITDIQLKYTPDGKFRQFCFIGYKTDQQAEDAINFFNNTCFNTNKIVVESCANLGDAAKPKSWSKYAADSTAYKNNHPEEAEVTPIETNDEKPKKENKMKQLLEKYKDDPMFEEFMHLHGATNINTILSQLNIKEVNSEDEETTKKNRDAENESDKSEEEKVANTKISDLEYMKLLMAKSLDQKSELKKRTEKKLKEKIKLYTVKLKGLPYTCKKKDIKQFFNPVVPYSIRIPPRLRGFAYAGFKTEKIMKQALNKDRSFIGGKRISVIQYTLNEGTQSEQNNDVTRKHKWITQEEALKNEEDIAESGRIFLRNLSYCTVEDDVQQLFSKYGPLTEVNVPIDKNTRKPKGFGVVTFLMPEHAVKAYVELDGSVFQGRMLHLLPGKAKDSADDLTNTGLSYKQKKSLKNKLESGSSHNWNTLFMGQNAVAEIIADTYGTSKESVLDGRSKGSAAVRVALGETQLVAETKQFLEDNGVRLEAFNQPSTQRSKTIILAKNLPAQTRSKEIRNLFEHYGILGRVILPPCGITALIEFLEPSEARKAFTKLAYSKFKNAPLYLEWAPDNTLKTFMVAKPKTYQQNIGVEDILSGNDTKKEEKKHEEKKKRNEKDANQEKAETISKTNKNIEPEKREDEDEPEPETTLFVKNLNFATTEENLRKHFEPCGKVHYVMIAMKKDPQKPGKKLSMGYGFVQFQYKTDANEALKTLQQSILDGKSLEIKRSERTLQNEVKTIKRKVNNIKQTGSKILIRNVPFQANKSEIQELFKAFGEIKALRLPKKLSLGAESHRGFAFVEYVSKSDAKRAFDALSQSTHLYGRRLVLEWASTEEDVEQLRKRTAEHFHRSEETRSKKSVLDVDSVIGSKIEFV